MVSRRKLPQPKRGVIYSPEGNRRIRLHIARYEDRITALVNGAFPLGPNASRDAILRELGSFGDYLLDTDIRFCEELG